MEIKSFGELIDWTRQVHAQLARGMEKGAVDNDDVRAKGLLEYLSSHERELEQMVAEFEQRADGKALKTQAYDHFSNNAIEARHIPESNFEGLDYDAICGEVFHVHNQVIELYRDLVRKSPIPEAKEVMSALLEMEQHEAMLLAQQANRGSDM